MIHIITDSMSDIKQDEASALQIQVLPLYIHFEEETFEDNVTINTETFYQRLREAQKLPKTSQVIPDAFFNAYQKALASGSDALVITGSSELSGTHQSAVIAKDMLSKDDQDKVHLIDSRSASLGEAMLVHEAVRLRDCGNSVEEIKNALDSLIPLQQLAGQVEDLKYLVMGGRLSSVSAKVGTMLRIKPMLRLNSGKLEMAGIARGSRNAYEWLASQLKSLSPDPARPLYLAGACAGKAVDALMNYLTEKGLMPSSFHIMDIGPVIGAHTGPGCVAISWIQTQKKTHV